MDTRSFPGRLGLQQRVLPSYRKTFFDALADACQGGLGVFAGEPLPVEGIATVDRLDAAQFTLGQNWHFRDPRSGWYLCWQRGLLDWLQDWDPEALIVEANPRYLSTRRAVSWMRARGRPIVGWGLGAPELGGQLAFLRRLERYQFLRSLDTVIAYSHRGAREYQSLGFPPDKIFVASNAVTTRPEKPPPKRPLEFAERPTGLFVGRLQARKRVGNLLKACASLSPDSRPRLIVVGDGPARGEFEAVARSIYPLAEFVGAKYGSELDAYFVCADLFVLPGSGGLAVQQAMSHGLPVIVAQGDGTQDDLVRPENGWQVPPDDLTALRGALQEAFSDATRLRRMGEESYRIVAEEVNVEAMVGVFLKALSAM